MTPVIIYPDQTEWVYIGAPSKECRYKMGNKIASICMKNPTGLDLDNNIQIILYNGADLINAILLEK